MISCQSGRLNVNINGSMASVLDCRGAFQVKLAFQSGNQHTSTLVDSPQAFAVLAYGTARADSGMSLIQAAITSEVTKNEFLRAITFNIWVMVFILDFLKISRRALWDKTRRVCHSLGYSFRLGQIVSNILTAKRREFSPPLSL